MIHYKNYKTTSYDWLPLVPEHWEKKSIREITQVSSERRGNNDFTLLSVYREYGVIPKSSRDDNHNVESADLSKYKVVYPGNIVLNKMKMWQGSLGVSPYLGIVSPAYIVCKLISEEIDGKYLHFLLRSSLFKTYYNRYSYGIRVGQWDMHYTDFKNLNIYIPSQEEQIKIVDFLNWQTSKINQSINIKKKELKELDSLKRSIASNAVTHGLNPDVPTKFSGVKWLGDIPEHWEIRKLREILRPVSVKNRPDLPLLSVVREQGVIVRDVEDKESNHNFIPDDLSGYKVVRKGQFAMNKMKAWQGSYGVSDYTGIVSPAYFIFDVAFDNLEYFHFAIRSKVYVNFFAQASDGIRVGQWDLKMNKMKEIPFIVPPAEEQIAIVKYVREAVQKYDVAIAKLSEQIAVLEEYKAKLISDVVTGKVDVRDVEIPEYEYVEELVDDADAGDDFEESEDVE